MANIILSTTRNNQNHEDKYPKKWKIYDLIIWIWVSEWLLFNTNSAIFQLYHGENKLILQWDDDEIHFVLDQHAELDFYGVSSLKQQPADRHVAPLGHIILIPSQPVFALTP
jgi:hypothetical protein